jgi:hypothetical protein
MLFIFRRKQPPGRIGRVSPDRLCEPPRRRDDIGGLIIGVEGEEFEDLMTRSDPRLWEMIESRRKMSKTFSASEMRRRLGVAKKRRP